MDHCTRNRHARFYSTSHVSYKIQKSGFHLGLFLILNKKTGLIEHKHFYDIVDYLKKGDVLVMNNSKVIPARLIGKKETGGKVEVYFSSTDSTVSLHVSDNGPGVENENYDKVFERFHRGEGHVLSGCGIGLAIVDEIAHLHMAKINLSKPEGHSGLHVEVVFEV